MIAFGERLRRAREASGISLVDLSARTKIRLTVLDAIERADLARLPSSFYAKTFLRAYAAEVHLDPEPIIEEYSALVEAPALARRQTELPGDRNGVPPILFGVVRRGLAPAGMFALAAILLFFANNFRQTDRPNPLSEAEPGATATSGTTPPSPAAERTPTSEDSMAASRHQPELLTVEVRPAGLLWLEGTADGQRVIKRLLQPQEKFVVEAHNEIGLLIGDAAAFDFSINGRPGRPLGRPGEVRTLAITRDNYREFLLPASPH